MNMSIDGNGGYTVSIGVIDCPRCKAQIGRNNDVYFIRWKDKIAGVCFHCFQEIRSENIKEQSTTEMIEWEKSE